MTWFETTEFPDRIFRVREPALKPLHGANAWLIRGASASLLVDTGIGVAPLRPVVEALCPGPIVCLLTHSHYDHIGGAHEFADRRAHRAEASVLSDPNPKATQWGGWLGPESFSRPPSAGFDFATYAITPAPPTGWLEDGDRIDLGDRVVTVLHAPGHSPGLLCAFEEKTGALFSGDALYDGRMFFDLEGSDPGAAARSIARLLGLDVRVVHPGHFESLSRESFRALGAKVLAELRRGVETSWRS
jgi:glyoxylase-like metal-dependent hydrolase (beta-lactamase superfamily II)